MEQPESGQQLILIGGKMLFLGLSLATASIWLWFFWVSGQAVRLGKMLHLFDQIESPRDRLRLHYLIVLMSLCVGGMLVTEVAVLFVADRFRSVSMAVGVLLVFLTSVFGSQWILRRTDDG